MVLSPSPNFRDYLRCEPIRPEGFEGLNDEPTLPKLETGFFCV
jgi:hypothetical protein